jgi:prefoldin subunit 5
MTVKRWTDEMLDKLADKVDDLTDNMQGLRVTTQALLQIATQHQQKMQQLEERQAENDARFNVLLEEVRYLIRHQNNE